MKDSEKAKCVVNIVKDGLKAATEAYVRAYANRAAVDSGFEAWKESNPDDGVGSFSGNPYHPEQADEEYKRALESYQLWQEVYDYAINVFLNGLDEKES